MRNLSEKINELTHENEKLQLKNMSLKALLSKYDKGNNAEVLALKNKIKNLHGINTQLTNKLKKYNDNTKNAIQALKWEMKNMKSNYESQINSLNKTINELKNNALNYDNNIDRLKKRNNILLLELSKYKQISIETDGSITDWTNDTFGVYINNIKRKSSKHVYV